MTRHTSRLALAVFDRFIPDNEALKGDLIEECRNGRSQWWLWRQVAAAIVHHYLQQPSPTPLNVEMLLVGSVVLLLVSFEAVLVTNVLRRLLFGPPLPVMSGLFYMMYGHRLPRAAMVVEIDPLPWLLGLAMALAVAVPLGWMITRTLQRRYKLSLMVFAASIMGCAALNVWMTFIPQLTVVMAFVLGLFVGGQIASAVVSPEDTSTL